MKAEIGIKTILKTETVFKEKAVKILLLVENNEPNVECLNPSTKLVFSIMNAAKKIFKGILNPPVKEPRLFNLKLIYS